MKPKLVDAFNAQIQAEFQSAYTYLGMAAWFTENNLPGFAQWMRIQWQEETMHAMKLHDFLHSRGESVTLRALVAPSKKYSSAVQVFEQVRKHEQSITASINDLYELALKEKDLPSQIVLQWFINEQVEEEALVMEIIERLKLVGSDGPSVYLLDRQMAVRPTPTTGTTA
ncbi:MAG: ferritin [Candidatus Kapabacteria bacterium]|nr:ferritin [Candidatus Kapabacteria bacterium]